MKYILEVSRIDEDGEATILGEFEVAPGELCRVDIDDGRLVVAAEFVNPDDTTLNGSNPLD